MPENNEKPKRLSPTNSPFADKTVEKSNSNLSTFHSKNYEFRAALYEKTQAFIAKQIESKPECCLAKFVAPTELSRPNDVSFFIMETRFLPIQVIASVEVKLNYLAEDLERLGIKPTRTKSANKILRLIEDYKKSHGPVRTDITIIPTAEMRQNQETLLSEILNVLSAALKVDGAHLTMITEYTKSSARHPVTQDYYISLIQLVKGCLEYEACHKEALSTVTPETKTEIFKKPKP